MRLSARDQIPARVASIDAGEAIANVELAADGVRLVASITVDAVRELGLAEGSNVTAVIKAPTSCSPLTADLTRSPAAA
jgi:molybdate transport system regulatory protein